MPVIYIRQQGAMVRKRGGRLLIEVKDAQPVELLLKDLEGVSLFGSVQISTQALTILLERAIPVSLYTRNGRRKGRLSPARDPRVHLRLAQFLAYSHPEHRLRLARSFVETKLEAAIDLLRGYSRNYTHPDLASGLAALQDAQSRLPAAQSPAELMGLEGAAAARYFRAFALLNRSGLPFPGRRRRPATDPFNALLNLGYTMVLNELTGLVESAGLDPYIGFLHGLRNGRPSLALDLLEGWRAQVDRLVLRIVNLGILSPADFVINDAGPHAGGVILAPGAWTKWIGEYEKTFSRLAGSSAPRSLWAEEIAILKRVLLRLTGGPTVEEFHNEPQSEDLND